MERLAQNREKAQKLVVWFGMAVSSVCGVMGFPCVEGFRNLLFRLTCVGYFTGLAVGFYVCQEGGWRNLFFRFALGSNALASWIVSMYWCLDFGDWVILMFLELSFMVIGVLVLPGSGLIGHLLFTFQGSIVLFCLRDTETLRVNSAQSRVAKYWITMLIFTVSSLVIGMTASGYMFLDHLRNKVQAIYHVIAAPSEDFNGKGTPTSGKFGTSETAGLIKVPFDNLDLGARIGHGSFGQVYSGIHEGSTVAVKIIHWGANARKKARAMAEAVLASSLDHNNLVRTIAYECVGGDKAQGDCGTLDVWVVQEWCDRGTFSEHCAIPRCDKEGLVEVWHMFAGICSGGAYLHQRGIIHGDLSGNNVLLQSADAPYGYVCKVCDFGLAKVLEGVSSGVFTTQIGTVSHMPPELFIIDGGMSVKLHPKVDVYSTGMLLWQACRGELPFAGMSSMQIVISVERGKRLHLTNVCADVSRLFASATHDDPAQRPTFAELCRTFAEPPPEV